jgi:hypothetical protein
MTTSGEQLIAEAVARSEEVRIYDVGDDSNVKQRLLIEVESPDRTVAALRDILAPTNMMFERGVPVRLAFDQLKGGMIVEPMTPDMVILQTHLLCRPYKKKRLEDGTVKEVDAVVPFPIARMYLGCRDWRLRPLNGIASSPLLMDNGTISSNEGYDANSGMWCESESSNEGYDANSGMWCESVPDLSVVPSRPTNDQAAAALRLLREQFKTFCFGDAATIQDAAFGIDVVDTSLPPGKDESAFLVGLLTAVCRPSLHLAPGLLVRAAPISGAGAGKGLLVRAISTIAFGREPHAVTSGATPEELEKRIAAELMEGGPVLFLDNLNNTTFKSDLLASAITERPSRVRLLGKSQMVLLNASAFIALTGNGLSVSEDLARRFISVELDSRTEDPETRTFPTDLLAELRANRAEGLSACLTIWRWGRQTVDLPAGKRLGSFEQWGRWVRDPLLALGCQDPVDRVAEAKQRDGRRQAVASWFRTWHQRHGHERVQVRDLHDEVTHALDPHGRGRQYLASLLEKHTGTMIGGFVLTRQAPAGKWGAATYALKSVSDVPEHRGHRGHPDQNTQPMHSDAPDAPYADAASTEHRGHRGHPHQSTEPTPDAPDAPYADGASTEHRGHRGHPHQSTEPTPDAPYADAARAPDQIQKPSLDTPKPGGHGNPDLWWRVRI